MPNVSPTSSTLLCVVVPEPNSYDMEYVSPRALEVLDELRIRVMECLLVLQALPAEADLNLDELEEDLHVARLQCGQAYEAASLVHQAAALDERWGESWSRPKAVFARHNAAVRQGARRVRPMRARGDELEWRLWQLPAPDRVQNFGGARPQCSGVVRSTGNDCRSTAVYLGAGTFGAHCYSHATPGEREKYRDVQDAADAQEAMSFAELVETQQTEGRAITAEWIEQRAARAQRADAVEWTEDGSQ